jgi:hypothetical protein
MFWDGRYEAPEFSKEPKTSAYLLLLGGYLLVLVFDSEV